MAGKKIEKEVVGLCYSPEYIYSTRKGEFVPDHKNNGFAFINETGIKEIGEIHWNQLLVSGTGNLEKAINSTLKGNGTTVVLQKDHTSYSVINDEITQHKEIGLIFVMVFLFIAILVTITTVHRLLNSQRLQIGILKSMGFIKDHCIFTTYHSTFVIFRFGFRLVCRIYNAAKTVVSNHGRNVHSSKIKVSYAGRKLAASCYLCATLFGCFFGCMSQMFKRKMPRKYYTQTA